MFQTSSFVTWLQSFRVPQKNLIFLFSRLCLSTPETVGLLSLSWFDQIREFSHIFGIPYLTKHLRNQHSEENPFIKTKIFSWKYSNSRKCPSSDWSIASGERWNELFALRVVAGQTPLFAIRMRLSTDPTTTILVFQKSKYTHKNWAIHSVVTDGN